MVRPALAAALLAAAPVYAEPRVIAELAADITGDGVMDLALLVGEARADLLILKGAQDGSFETPVHLTGIGFSSGVAEGPRLGVNPVGSLTLTSSNFGIGRHKWEQTVTIAYRDGSFRLAGLTYNAFDSLDLDVWRRCDLNLLTGRGTVETVEGEQVWTGIPQTRPLSDWDADELWALCSD
ncbi:MAG: hypothetical protein AAGA78_05335 [Pseudomonadota bacterium]